MQKPNTAFASLGASLCFLKFAGVFPARDSSASEGRRFVVTHGGLMYREIVLSLVCPLVYNVWARVSAPYGWRRPSE